MRLSASLRIRRVLRRIRQPRKLLYEMMGGPSIFRQYRSYQRVLPTFLIIGAMRSGTTSLYNGIITHPDVKSALKKEIHFFNSHYSRGEGWYRAHFPKITTTRRSGNLALPVPVSGEATPHYLYDPRVPGRVRNALPAVRLIAILRNPVDRAYSNYWHQVRRGFEALSFAEAIEREPHRLAVDTAQRQSTPGANRFNVDHFSYLQRGLYARQVSRWLAIFPGDQLTVISTEQFQNDPIGILYRLAADLRLDIAGWYPDTSKRFNLSRYPPMPEDIRSSLKKHFKPHNQELFEILGESFDWDQ